MAGTTPRPDVIVSRHSAAIEWLQDHIQAPPYGVWEHRDYQDGTAELVGREDGWSMSRRSIPILPVATPDDVRGKIVAGNLPPYLASLARRVYAIEFAGDPPRGREYTADDMEAAGAYLHPYAVVDLAEDGHECPDGSLVVEEFLA